MFVLKEIRIRKELYVLLTINLVFLVSSILIWQGQVGVPHERSAVNLVLLKK